MWIKNEKGIAFFRDSEKLCNGKKELLIENVNYRNLRYLLLDFSKDVKVLKAVIKDLLIFYKNLAVLRAFKKHATGKTTKHRDSREKLYSKLRGLITQLSKINQEIIFESKNESVQNGL